MSSRFKVHPQPEERDADSSPREEDLQPVLDQLHAHVQHSINRGLSLEQLFLHFAHNQEGLDVKLSAHQSTRPDGRKAGQQVDITPALLHETLAELHIPSTLGIAQKLVTRYSGGKCVLLREQFKSLVLPQTGSQRRELVPKSLQSQRAKSCRILPAFSSREEDSDHVDDNELDPLVRQRFCLNPDQIVVRDDPSFSECFIPLQIGDLCSRLAYESQGDPAFDEHFETLSSMMRKLIYVRMYTSATEAFQLYANHDPDSDQQETMRAKDYIGVEDVVGTRSEHSHTLNLRLFERVLSSFCEDANYLRISEQELDKNWTKTFGKALNLRTEWEQNAVEMKAFERGRRLVDQVVERDYTNLWGRLLPGTWAWVSPRHVCRKHKRAVMSDHFGDWPLFQQPSQGSAGGDLEPNDDDDEFAEPLKSARTGACCTFCCRTWVPWWAAGRHHTWFYRTPDGTLVQRRRVFSRLLVQFRVDKPQSLRSKNYAFVKRLASRHLAMSGGGDANEDADGNSVSNTRRATEQASQFVFLKLFKDFPIDEIELSRPFVGAEMKNIDMAFIVVVTVVGLVLTGYEAYEIATEDACTEGDARQSCDPNAPFHQQTYGRLMAILVSMILYFVKAGFQWVNKLTAFNAELVKTLFFRVVDNNRGALAVMLNEAEMQEQREALLCYFFLHFHWLGPDDNRFERRPQGAGLPRSILDYEIEQWLLAVTGVKVNFDMEDAVRDLHWLGLIRQITDPKQAAEAIQAAGMSDIQKQGSGQKKTESKTSIRASFRAGAASKHVLCRNGLDYNAAGDPSCTKPVCLLDLFKDLDRLIHTTQSVDVPGLCRFEAATGKFELTLHDKGVPYGESECRQMLAKAEFVIPPERTSAAAARFDSVALVEGPIRRYGISFLAAVRVRWKEAQECGEREVNLFGVNSYDPGGRTGDAHASEAVGGDCQMTLTAISVVVMFALMLGADEQQIRTMQDACAPLIEALHGRTTAVNWVILQCLEAFLYESGSGNPRSIVSTYPSFLLEFEGGNGRSTRRWRKWTGKQHAHTRAYLKAFAHGGGGDAAVLPPQFFEKLRAKGQSEVLQPLPVVDALTKLEKLGNRLTKF